LVDVLCTISEIISICWNRSVPSESLIDRGFKLEVYHSEHADCDKCAHKKAFGLGHACLLTLEFLLVLDHLLVGGDEGTLADCPHVGEGIEKLLLFLLLRGQLQLWWGSIRLGDEGIILLLLVLRFRFLNFILGDSLTLGFTLWCGWLGLGADKLTEELAGEALLLELPISDLGILYWVAINQAGEGQDKLKQIPKEHL
jgi:hypothetical protein